jgi:hypothetical protein
MVEGDRGHGLRCEFSSDLFAAFDVEVGDCYEGSEGR